MKSPVTPKLKFTPEKAMIIWQTFCDSGTKQTDERFSFASPLVYPAGDLLACRAGDALSFSPCLADPSPVPDRRINPGPRV